MGDRIIGSIFYLLGIGIILCTGYLALAVVTYAHMIGLENTSALPIFFPVLLFGGVVEEFGRRRLPARSVHIIIAGVAALVSAAMLIWFYP